MTALLVGGFLLVASQNASRPSQPDFSGEWVVVDSKGATEGVATALTVRQPVVSKNVYGAPMPPAYLELLVERHLRGGVQSERYLLGTRGGTVELGGPASARASTSRSALWVENTLVITESFLNAEANVGHRRLEEWRLDAQNRLVITLTEERGKQSVVTVVTYRRR